LINVSNRRQVSKTNQKAGYRDREDLDLRFEYMEKSHEEIKGRMQYVEKQTSELVKIAFILEEQNKTNVKQNETMEKINENLTTLNNTTHRLGERVTDLETEVKEQAKKDTLVISDTVKKYVSAALMIAVGIIVTWAMAKMGIVK
jgi:predicted nuclease with TOPRIM domain